MGRSRSGYQLRAHDWKIGSDGRLVPAVRRRPPDQWIEDQRRESEEFRKDERIRPTLKSERIHVRGTSVQWELRDGEVRNAR